MTTKKTTQKTEPTKAVKTPPVRTAPPLADVDAKERLLAAARARAEEKRARRDQQEDNAPTDPKPITEGPVDKIVEVLVNPSPEKMLEVTDLDRNQVSLIPQVVVIDDLWDYIEQVAAFRSDSAYYERRYKKKYPETPDTSGKFVLMLARCRRSLGGKTQKALEDLALADLETRNNDNGVSIGGSGFED